tara:strand:- start:1214 stop:1330 length:117 start_codon:yes stop_codon:yes gene_type:complete
MEEEKNNTIGYSGEIKFHPINIITLIVKDGLIIGYNKK